MTPTITAFARSPDRGKGLARDMHIRWALEEVGQPYDVRLVSFSEMKEPAHLALHPFGQIPTYEEGDLALFETGSIVFHIAKRHAGLLPDDANARARAITWMFAALNTVEPPILELGTTMLLEGDKPRHTERRTAAQALRIPMAPWTNRAPVGRRSQMCWRASTAIPTCSRRIDCQLIPTVFNTRTNRRGKAFSRSGCIYFVWFSSSNADCLRSARTPPCLNLVDTNTRFTGWSRRHRAGSSPLQMYCRVWATTST